MALLLIATAVLGTASHWVNPRRIPWRQDWSNYVQQKASELGVPVVSLDEARLIVDRQSHIILDARPAADYAAGHLPGAFALPHAALETYLPPLQPLLSPSQPMMTYCSGLECDESLLLTRELHAMGFTNAVLFAGGMTAWRAAGLKVER
jgi:rhodanese-related sulfurtransferase